MISMYSALYDTAGLTRSLGMSGKQIPALDGSAAWLRACAFGADPQATNWLFTWPRFWPDLAHFSWISAIFGVVQKVPFPGNTGNR
jgi:hypothetical protein